MTNMSASRSRPLWTRSLWLGCVRSCVGWRRLPWAMGEYTWQEQIYRTVAAGAKVKAVRSGTLNA